MAITTELLRGILTDQGDRIGIGTLPGKEVAPGQQVRASLMNLPTYLIVGDDGVLGGVGLFDTSVVDVPAFAFTGINPAVLVGAVGGGPGSESRVGRPGERLSLGDRSEEEISAMAAEPQAGEVIPVASSVKWNVVVQGHKDLGEEQRFSAPDGLESLLPTFAFVPPLGPDRLEVDTPDIEVTLSCELSLTAKTTWTEDLKDIEPPTVPVSVPAVSLQLSPLLLPTLLFLFKGRNLTGDCVVALRPDSRLSKNERGVFETLAKLKEQVGTPLGALASVLKGIALFIEEVGNIADAVEQADNLGFIASDGEDDLSKYSWHGHIYGDTAVEDHVSSLALIGAPGQFVHLYQGRDRDQRDDDKVYGKLRLAIQDQLMVRIDRMDVLKEVTDEYPRPSATPEQGLLFPHPTVVCERASTSSDDKWEDVISSFEFGP